MSCLVLRKPHTQPVPALQTCRQALSPTVCQAGLVLRDHTFVLPLDHADAGGPTIDVFVREVTAAGCPDAAAQSRPALVYLQGKPRLPSGRQRLSLSHSSGLPPNPLVGMSVQELLY